MNINEILNNWKNYTNTNNVNDWMNQHEADYEELYDTENMISDFCNYFNYDNTVWNYLYNSIN